MTFGLSLVALTIALATATVVLRRTRCMGLGIEARLLTTRLVREDRRDPCLIAEGEPTQAILVVIHTRRHRARTVR